MASYSDIISDLDTIFASSSWTGHNIATYPVNVAPTAVKASEYIVIELLPTKPIDEEYGNSNQVAGLIIMQIYVPVNTGPRRVYEISDLLDEVLQKKQIGASLQTGSSACDVKGNDPDNPSLFRADYNLRFSSY
jgi:hypothetical protein